MESDAYRVGRLTMLETQHRFKVTRPDLLKAKSMELSLVEQNGKQFLEGRAGQPLLRDVDDTTKLVEACFNHQTQCLLLDAENLTDHFFDLSSREAGSILHKLRTYQIRLAVLWSPATRPLSRRFGDLMIEENRDRYFRLFEERSQAEAWLQED